VPDFAEKAFRGYASAKKAAAGWQYAGYRMTIFSNDEEYYLEKNLMGGGQIPALGRDRRAIVGIWPFLRSQVDTWAHPNSKR